MDKSWMLNSKAIRTAKECITIVKDELGIKLTLSHPDFMSLLQEYTELTDSAPLASAYKRLSAFADPTAGSDLRKESSKVTPLNTDFQELKKAAGDEMSTEVMVELNGKHYPAVRDGKKFKGLYRGQPVYR